MTEIYHYDQIDAQTEVYGVIADPVGHSLSPQIHNAAFAHLKLNKVYVPFRVPREDLAPVHRRRAGLGIRGLSVTIPHKEEIVKRLTEADGAVRGIGAANTVVFQGDARLGYNTDYRAAMSSLEEAVAVRRQEKAEEELLAGQDGPGARRRRGGHGDRPTDCSAAAPRWCIADGVARQANLLAKRLNCRSVEWSLRHTVTADMLVNCTPVGMHPNVDESPLRQALPAAVDDRLRRGLQPRKHAVDQGSPQPQLHRRDRRGDVRPPGLFAVQAVHRAGRSGGLDAGRDSPGDRSGEDIERDWGLGIGD